jgi:hypothetical protein
LQHFFLRVEACFGEKKNLSELLPIFQDSLGPAPPA